MILLALTSEPPSATTNYALLLALTSQKIIPPSPLNLTDTQHIQLPINAVLAGQQDYEQSDTEIEANDPDIRTRISLASGRNVRLSSNESSFRVRKDNKGYD